VQTVIHSFDGDGEAPQSGRMKGLSGTEHSPAPPAFLLSVAGERCIRDGFYTNGFTE
jgi:hypothetical protein